MAGGTTLSRAHGLQLRHRMLILGAGGVLVTSSVLVGVGAWQSARFSDRAGPNVTALVDADLAHVSTGVSRLVTLAGASVQDSVSSSMRVASLRLAERGVVTGGGDTTWTATDQVTKKSPRVTLPRVSVPGTWLGQNRDMRVATPFVDELRTTVGGRLTVFQRMNAAGDLLRVATNVPDANGRRAIGTYIPASGADGTPTRWRRRSRQARATVAWPRWSTPGTSRPTTHPGRLTTGHHPDRGARGRRAPRPDRDRRPGLR